MGTGVFLSGLNGRGVKLTTHLHLVPRLRMNGATPPHPLYTFKMWTGKTLFFLLTTAAGEGLNV